MLPAAPVPKCQAVLFMDSVESQNSYGTGVSLFWCYPKNFKDNIEEFVYMVDYIDGFSYAELSLHPWNEAYLIMVDDFSDVFLDSICQ
ncbi:hypothetical protein H671_5g13912 [Cricetulus griseus]|nr:hypothetical protein H671_5g13912 [Cricetulus griseus]